MNALHPSEWRQTVRKNGLERIDAVQKALAEYSPLFERDCTNSRRSTQYARLAVCEALIELIDNGDAWTEAEYLRDELGIPDELDRAAGMDERACVAIHGSARGL